MRKIIQLGETVRLYLDYLADPSALTFSMKQPNGTIISATYPTTEFVRESLGNYYLRVKPTMVGTHSYVFSAVMATGDEDVRNGKFDVEPTL